MIAYKRPEPEAHVAALFLDDLETESTSHLVESQLEQLGCHVQFFRTTAPVQAISQLQQAPYSLVVVDLLYPPEGRPNAPPSEQVTTGLDVIDVARSRLPKAVIVAVSEGNLHAFPRLLDQAKEAGADLAKYRGELHEHGGIRRLAAEIRRLLVERKIIADPVQMLWDEEDAGVVSVVADVGGADLLSLYKQIFKVDALEKRRLWLSYVRPGKSGAHVLMVETKMSGTTPTWHLLKLDRSKTALQKEADNSAALSASYPSLIRRAVDRTVAHVGDWHALATDFEDRAVTMRQWLAGGSAESTVISSVLESLFCEGGLSQGYDLSATDERMAGHVGEAFQFSPHRRLEIENALSELAEAATCPVGGQTSNFDDVRRLVTALVRDRQIADLAFTRTPREPYQCYCHGDLHGGNILITPSPVPRVTVVDTARFGPDHHWAADYARLAVDLVLRTIDGRSEAAFWTRLPFWRDVARAFGDGSVVPNPPSGTVGLESDPGTAPGLHALDWMAANLQRICPPVAQGDSLVRRRWEVHMAMAVEFLRCSGHTDLPTPKRVLALLAAYDAIFQARRALDESQLRPEG